MIARAPLRWAPVLWLALLLLAAPVAASHHEGVSAEPGGIEGAVLETMDAGGYTYVRVKTTDGDVWAAGPRTAVSVGDRVSLTPGATMTGFHSETLDRTFDSIQFVGAIRVTTPVDQGDREMTLAGVHGSTAAERPAGVEPVARADGGLTIAEIYARASDIAGKPVLVRGRVVKFNEDILGRNWIHIQDGTGAEGTHDLTVTTDAVVEVGDVIRARGTAAVDRDFGMGYRYALIVEKAAITVE